MKRDFDKVLTNDTYGIISAPISGDAALLILADYLLGEDWYIAAPVSVQQGNTYIVDAILKKYSRQYRKDLRKLIKENCTNE